MHNLKYSSNSFLISNNYFERLSFEIDARIMNFLIVTRKNFLAKQSLIGFYTVWIYLFRVFLIFVCVCFDEEVNKHFDKL